LERKTTARISSCEAALRVVENRITDVMQENFNPESTKSEADEQNRQPAAALPEQALEPPPSPVVPSCRHEYVRIFQRRLKGLDRRLVSTKAYLPIGFKIGDFGHLGDNSYCFCTKCRARLYPKRTQADKLQARLAAAAGKLSAEQAALAEQDLLDEVGSDLMQEVLNEFSAEKLSADKIGIDIHVEELEPEMVDVQDIEAEGVKLSSDEEDGCALSEEEN
jgi:hypothetical protein